MKKGPELFIEICDQLVGNPSLTNACRAVGIAPSTLFRWIADCAERPHLYEFEFADFGTVTLAQAIKLTRRMAVALINSEIHRRALLGNDEVVVFQGRLQYRDNPKFVGWTDEEMSALGFSPADRILRDKNGNPVPLTVTRPPSDALSLAVMKAMGGPEWADRRSVDVNVGGGVMVLGRKQPTPAAVAAPVVEATITEEPPPEPAQVQPAPVEIAHAEVGAQIVATTPSSQAGPLTIKAARPLPYREAGKRMVSPLKGKN
jgi:transposase-like protein